MNIPSQSEIEEAMKVLRVNGLRNRLASAGIDILKVSRQDFDQIMNISARIDKVQEDFNNVSRAAQQETDQKMQRLVAESNAKIADDVAKYNEIVSRYVKMQTPPGTQAPIITTLVDADIPTVEATLDNPSGHNAS